MSNSINNRHLTQLAQNMPLGRQDLAKYGHNHIIPLRAADGAIIFAGGTGLHECIYIMLLSKQVTLNPSTISVDEIACMQQGLNNRDGSFFCRGRADDVLPDVNFWLILVEKVQ